MSTSEMTPISVGGLYVDVPLDNSLNIAILVTLVVLLASIVATELFNIHVPYSKFAQDDAIKELPAQMLRNVFHMQINSRVGFFILYFVPLVSYIVLWIILASQNLDSIGSVAPSPTYSILLFAGWCATFGKRCLEVLFVHIYSGTIPVLSVLLIAIGYSGAGLVACAFSNQVIGYNAFDNNQNDTMVKDVICVIFFILGITVNFIAHYQLRVARLISHNNNNNSNRQHHEQKYLSPSEIGWLFKVFICPHYVFETIMFVAWSVFGATCAHYSIAIGVILYLGLRLRATYKWYVKQGLIETRRGSQQAMLLASFNSKSNHV